MTMGNTDRNVRFLGSTQGKHAERIDMAMNNHPALLLKETLQFALIFVNTLIRRNLKNPTAESRNLFAWDKRRIGVDEKIELYPTTIDMAIVVHNNGFNPAAVHFSNNLSNSNRAATAVHRTRSRHFPVLSTNMVLKVRTKIRKSSARLAWRT